MKKFLTLAIIIASMSSYGQTKVKIDSKGNYISTSDKKPDVKTGKTFTDEKGVVYDVYLNSKSKPYVIRKSKKTGKEYKQYLKLES